MSKKFQFSDLSEAQQTALKDLKSGLHLFSDADAEEIGALLTDKDVRIPPLRKMVAQHAKRGNHTPEIKALLDTVSSSQLLTLKGTVVFASAPEETDTPTGKRLKPESVPESVPDDRPPTPMAIDDKLRPVDIVCRRIRLIHEATKTPQSV